MECSQLRPCDGHVCMDLELTFSERQACVRAGTAWLQEYRELIKREQAALRREVLDARKQVRQWRREEKECAAKAARSPRPMHVIEARASQMAKTTYVAMLRAAQTKAGLGYQVGRDALSAAKRGRQAEIVARQNKRVIERSEKAAIAAESKRRHAELMELYKRKREMRKAAWEREKVDMDRRYREAQTVLARFAGKNSNRYSSPAERAQARKEYMRAHALVWNRDRGYTGRSESSLKRAKRKGVEIVNRPAVREFYRKMRDPHAAVYCTWCPGMTPLAVNERTVDHVIPLAQGGKHCVSNFVYACRSCNSSKSDMLPDEFVEKMLTER